GGRGGGAGGLASSRWIVTPANAAYALFMRHLQEDSARRQSRHWRSQASRLCEGNTPRPCAGCPPVCQVTGKGILHPHVNSWVWTRVHWLPKQTGRAATSPAPQLFPCLRN